MPVQTTRDTFKGYSVDSKLNTLFDIAVAQHTCQEEQLEKHNKRFVKLEKRKKFNTAVAAGSGLAGGFLAMIAKFSFWG